MEAELEEDWISDHSNLPTQNQKDSNIQPIEGEKTIEIENESNGVNENPNEDIRQTTGILFNQFLFSYSIDIQQENNDAVEIEEENIEQKSQDDNGVIENLNEDIRQTTGIL